MEAYLLTFVNQKQNYQAKPMLMAEFMYYNTNNTSIGFTPFEPNYSYHFQMFFKEKLIFT